MKKQLKLIIMILSLALTVGAALGVSVSAEGTEPEISIESYNVSFSGEVHLFYAVNNSLAAKDGAEITKVGVKLSLSSSDVADRQVFEASSSTAKYKDTDYPTFSSFGIPAKNLDDVIYATPYAEYSDGTTLLGEEVSYSVLEYCFEMILVDAPAAAGAGEISASKCKNMQAALRSLLTYGEDVQQYLGHETENLPSDYVYAVAEGCTVNGSSLVFAHASELSETLTFTRTGDIPEGKIFVGWNLTYLDGSVEAVAADGDTYEVACESVKVSPIYYDDTKATNFEILDPNAANVVNTNNTTDGSFRFDTSAADPANAANKCLKATVWANAYSSATANTTVVANSDYTAESKLDGNASHFEADLYISSKMPNSDGTSVATGNVFQITLMNGNNKNIGNYTFAIVDNSGAYAEPVIRIQRNFGTKSYLLYAVNDDGSGAIGFDEWFNVAFTLYADADGNTGVLIKVSTADGRSYKFFDSDAIKTTYPSTIASDVAVKSAKITWMATSTHRDVYLDNVVCETLEGETYTK